MRLALRRLMKSEAESDVKRRFLSAICRQPSAQIQEAAPQPELKPDLCSLSGFVHQAENTLQELRREVRFRLQAEDSQPLHDLAKRFGTIAKGAEIWGFESLYRVSFELQSLIMELAFGTRQWTPSVICVLEEVLDLIPALLSECEKDYHHRVRVAYLLDSLSLPATESA